MDLIKKTNRDQFYFDFVNIVNGVLQLSNREAEVFSYLLMADAGQPGYADDVNNRNVRSVIKAKLGISEANLSRYLHTIKAKGLIVKNSDNRWSINSNIKPVVEYDEETNKYEVKVNFILKILRQNDNKAGEKLVGTYSGKHV
jgi:predicted transcriptional regulator